METHPANAGVALEGFLLWPSELYATVDEQPVAVVVDEELSVPSYFDGYYIMVLRVVPPPLPGQVVHIHGNPCGPWDGSCELDELDLSYIAGRSDHVAPAPPSAVFYDTLDYGSLAPSGCDCPPVRGRYIISITAELDKPEGEMIAHVYGTRPQGEPDAELTPIEVSYHPMTTGERGWGSAPTAEPLAQALCAGAYTVDLSGNRSEVVESCTVCRDQLGPLDDCAWICPVIECHGVYFACETIVNVEACPQDVLEWCEIGDTDTATSTTTTTRGEVNASATSEGSTASESTGQGDVESCVCVSAAGDRAPVFAWAFVVLLATRRRRAA